MSRTVRIIPHWVKGYLKKWPNDKDPRSEIQNGYDDHSRSPLMIGGWKERINGSGRGQACGRKQIKRLANRKRRNYHKQGIENEKRNAADD